MWTMMQTWMWPMMQTTPAPPAAHEAQTMTLVDKAEKLRTHFGMERALPVNAVVIARARSTSIIK